MCSAVHEIHITDIRKMKSLFPSLANKCRNGTIHESDVFLKKEKDGCFSQVLVTGDYPAKAGVALTLLVFTLGIKSVIERLRQVRPFCRDQT